VPVFDQQSVRESIGNTSTVREMRSNADTPNLVVIIVLVVVVVVVGVVVVVVVEVWGPMCTCVGHVCSLFAL
jgi:uncharacterized membrane protein